MDRVDAYLKNQKRECESEFSNVMLGQSVGIVQKKEGLKDNYIHFLLQDNKKLRTMVEKLINELGK